jgi:hypothetical protein
VTKTAEESAPAISSSPTTLQSTNEFLKSILSKTPYAAALGVGAVVCSFAYIKVFYNAPIHRISPVSISKVTGAIDSIGSSPPSQLSFDTLCAMHDYLAALKELFKRRPNMDEPAGSKIWHGEVRSSGCFARFFFIFEFAGSAAQHLTPVSGTGACAGCSFRPSDTL